MKVRYYFLIAAVALLAACAPEQLRPRTDGEALRGVIDADLTATKAILLDNPGIRLESYWSAGDQIGVFGGSAENVQFGLKPDDLLADGKTADFRSEASIPSGKLTAYAPYQASAGKDGGAILIDFPDKQAYTTQGGVASPDPAAHILLGEGTKAGGLTFRPVMAALKIGQVFDEETVVKAVEFRDLSGAAVSGAMKIMPGDSPKAEVTGEGKVITLDLGDGLEFSAGAMRPLFLIVPARAYPQGFEITFIDSKGDKTVKTVGTTQGKTLARGVVYLIGDISGRQAPESSKTVLKEGAMIMTPERLDKIRQLEAPRETLYDENGKECENQNGVPIRRPVLSLMVHKDLKPVEGGWLIFDQPSETLPDGGVYKITRCVFDSDPYYSVLARPEVNFAAPFEEVTVGGPLIDETGEFLEGGGVELDLASALIGIQDAEGNPIPFSRGPAGQILFDEEATNMLVGEPETKAILKKTFTSPKLFFKHSEKYAEVTFGAQMSLAAKFAARMMEGELQYLHLTLEPEFKLDASFALKLEKNITQPFHLVKLLFAPILVAPGVVLTPTVDISGGIGVGGDIQFSTSVDYTYNMGMYGLTYNRGQGFSAQYREAAAPMTEVQPSLGGFAGSLYAFGSLTVAPYLSVYGLFGLGVEAEFKLKFGLGNDGAWKLFLAPELELIPSVASLGGYFTHRFSDFSTNFELDPIWEMYLSPKVTEKGSFAVYNNYSEEFYSFPSLNGGKGWNMQVYTSRTDWAYKFKLEGKTGWDFAVEARIMTNDRVTKFYDEDSPDVPNDDGDTFNMYKAEGIPHMFGMQAIAGVSGDPEIFYKHALGTYEAGTEAKDFEGSFTAPPAPSGKPYWMEVVMTGGGQEVVIDSGRKKVYYWPNDYYGRPYNLPSESQ